ncbi:glutathione S-transferase family protein [Actibacterium sp. 188UL27-1]|uniref:glutathione S-transferase family protein n=1 Tax=Actibacterium sp. 188UL27-1 TaxID=2786961 RepID=UPI00195BA9FA|nr:glutathione S-transferase family protein [Actibacterium sp. 188UL27-1]MBM7067772.1 glutathione S-transferase family protein [Actibacterium sp. 188UL27-1]
MSEIVLHHVPASRSFRVLWMLTELGLEAEIVVYSIRDGSLQKPDVLAKTPAGRVPALEIDDLTLFESGAIIQYLAETREAAGFHRAPGHAERGRYLEVIHFAETMGSLIEQLNLNHVFLRDPAQASPVVIKLNTRRLEATLRALDGLLGDQDYLLPSGFSAADVMLGFNLMAAPYFVRLDGLPRVTAYRDRIAERAAYQAAQARDGVQDFYAQDFYPIPGAS